MPLDETQERFLQVLGLSEAVFTNPSIPFRPCGKAGCHREEAPDETPDTHVPQPTGHFIRSSPGTT